MSIDLDIVPKQACLITPDEIARVWASHHGTAQTSVLDVSTRTHLASGEALAVSGFYVVEYSDGINVSLFVSCNADVGRDEEEALAEYGDPSCYGDLIAAWRAIGLTYVVSLSGGAYGPALVRRMKQTAAVIATLVDGVVMVLDPWYGLPRGLFDPEALF